MSDNDNRNDSKLDADTVDGGVPSADSINEQIDRYIEHHIGDSNYLSHAYAETNFWRESDDEMSHWMATNMMRMVALFSMEGHSGFSAGIAIKSLEKLLKFEPLRPLTGEDDEWNVVSGDEDTGEDNLWQNNRCGAVFKRADGSAYYLDGFYFVEPPHDATFTCNDSSIEIEFPFVPPESIRIELDHEDEDHEEAIRRHGYDPRTGKKLSEKE